MKIKLLATIIVLLFFSASNSFSQSSITLSTDSPSYEAGSLIKLTGKTDPPLSNQIVAIEIKDNNNQSILLRSVQTDDSGAFELDFRTQSSATPGTYNIIANSFVNGEKATQTYPITIGPQAAATSGKKNGCLIATAAFGSEMSPQVQLLREIRDNQLLHTQSGSSFMSGFNAFYYSFSPTVADWERENPVFKETVKATITPLITTLSILQYVPINSEATALGFGIGIIMLNIGMYFVAPTFAAFKIKNLIQKRRKY